MNLFELICRNSHYLKREKLSVEEKKAKYKEFPALNKKYFAFVESSVPSLMCPIKVIEDFLGEEYDFEKHVKPLIDEKIIWIRDWVNCFPHSEKLAKNSKKKHGMVGDYTPGTDVRYLQFYLGEENPNKDKKFDDAWI